MLGQRLHNFAIMRLLGEGGMSSVYEAEHSLIRRKVAVKVLKSELSVDGAQVQRFFNEARATSAIRHPNIVEVIDVGRLPDGVPYLVMELLEGESLGDRLERLGSLEIPLALDFIRQAASALLAAHALRIVHRDLKPDNLFLVPDQRIADRELVKVLDFGIAKLRGDLAAPPFDTMVGAVLGTPPYMSPEQCRGLPEEIDERTDIYALGIILYEMLCGRPPFLADGAGELMMMHMTEKPQPPSELREEISPALERVILRTLEKRREDRFETMLEFDAALIEILISLGEFEQYAIRRSVPAAIGGRSSVVPATPVRSAANFESDTTLSAHPPADPMLRDAERERAVTRALSRRPPEDSSASGVVALGRIEHPPSSGGTARVHTELAIAAAEFDEEPATSQLSEVDVEFESEATGNPAPAEVPITTPPPAAAAPRVWLPVALGAASLAAVIAFGVVTARRSSRSETSTAAASRAPASQTQQAQAQPQSQSVQIAASPEPPASPMPIASLASQPAAAEPSGTGEPPEAALQPVAAADPNPAPAARGPNRASERGRAQPAKPLTAAARHAPASPPVAAKGGAARLAPDHTDKSAEDQSRERADASKLRRGVVAPPRAAALSMSDFEAESASQSEGASAARVAGNPSSGPGSRSGSRPEGSQAEPGYLSLDSAPWSDVFLGSDRLGTTPLIRVPLPPGKYLLTLRNPELGVSTSYAVEIQAGKTVSRLVGWEHR